MWTSPVETYDTTSEIVTSAVSRPWYFCSWWLSIRLSFGQIQSIPQYTTSSIFGCHVALSGRSVDGFTARGEHHHWQIITTVAQASQDREPVITGHHQIEHHQIGPLKLQAGGELLAVVEGAHLIALLAEVGAQQLAQF